MEIEKRVLGQNGIEFQEKMIENIKMGKTPILRTLYASYLSSTRNLQIQGNNCDGEYRLQIWVSFVPWHSYTPLYSMIVSLSVITFY